MRRTVVFAFVAVGAVAGLTTLVPAEARDARPDTISIIAPSTLRLDRQEASSTVVVFSGVDRAAHVRTSFGDGTPTVNSAGTCSPSRAIKNPRACIVRLPHRYAQAGTYTITARLGRRVAQKQVTILPVPARWSPPAGWVQPSGWTPNNGGATFYPCQDVTWFFDRIDEPSDRIHMIDDVRTALTMLASETKLRFTEVASEADAVMDFHWKDLPVLESGVGVAGQAGGGNGTATVWFSRTEPYASDSHGGVALDDGWGNALPGRVWLAVHEIMHGIGFSHTQDFTEIMYHTGLNARFGQGDLDGLHTMYLDQPCPPG